MKETALIYGILLGDGCLSKGKKGFFISITGHFEDDVPFFDKIQPLLSKMRGKRTKYYLRKTQGKIEFNFSDKNLFNQFHNLGFPIGKKGDSILIPDVLCNCFMKEVLQGYFAADGSVILTNNNGIIYPRLEIKSISKKLLDSVKSYLDNLGLRANIYTNSEVPNGSTIHRLQMNGRNNLFEFKNKIGFYNPKHEVKFRIYEKIKSAADGI